jgi:hypothetical protein
MASLDRSKEELFIEENAEKLVHNLAYYCAACAKEIEEVVRSHKLKDFNTDAIFSISFLRPGND